MVWFYLKLFFLTGFGVCMGVFTWVFTGPNAAIRLGTFAGVFFGLAMSWIMGTMHLACTRGQRDRYAVPRGGWSMSD